MGLKRPIWLVFLLGFLLMVLYYIPHPLSVRVQQDCATWVRIIGNCALLLGVASLLQTHTRKLRRRQAGYGYSVVLMIAFAAMVVFGLLYGVKRPDHAGAFAPGYWMFQTFKVPLEASMYALLAFFIASAACRAFRARSWAATLMLVAAVIVILGRIPLGAVVPHPLPGHDPLLFEASQWLLDVPTTAAKRALLLGIGLSVVATSLRIILGLERAYLGRG